MKRHPALQDLSRDHFTALLRATHVGRAANGDDKVPPFDQARAAFQTLWDQELALHFDEEDATLRPRLGDAPELLEHLDVDHADLRAMFEDPPADDDKAGWTVVAQRLIQHARWEEEHLFQWLQQHLDEDGLQALWDESRAFRHAHRGDDAIGPA